MKTIQTTQAKNLRTIISKQIDVHKKIDAGLQKSITHQQEEAKWACDEADRSNRNLNRIIQGQEDLLEGQDAQKVHLEEIKQKIIRYIQEKLELATGGVKKACDTATEQSAANVDT